MYVLAGLGFEFCMCGTGYVKKLELFCGNFRQIFFYLENANTERGKSY